MCMCWHWHTHNHDDHDHPAAVQTDTWHQTRDQDPPGCGWCWFLLLAQPPRCAKNGGSPPSITILLVLTHASSSVLMAMIWEWGLSAHQSQWSVVSGQYSQWKWECSASSSPAFFSQCKEWGWGLPSSSIHHSQWQQVRCRHCGELCLMCQTLPHLFVLSLVVAIICCGSHCAIMIATTAWWLVDEAVVSSSSDRNSKNSCRAKKATNITRNHDHDHR